MITNNGQWIDYDILGKNVDFFKVKQKYFNTKFFSWEILSLTWHVISLPDNPPTEYSYNWYFYSCEIKKKISSFIFTNKCVQCAKKVIIH